MHLPNFHEKDKGIHFFIITIYWHIFPLPNALNVMNVSLYDLAHLGLEISDWHARPIMPMRILGIQRVRVRRPMGNGQQEPMLYLHGNLLA